VDTDLDVTVSGHVATIEIRRGPANYFDHALLGAIADACLDLAQTRDCRAIVLCSEGKHFCAGADFGSGPLAEDRERASAALYEQGIRLFDVELPIIAAVQGAAVGGGLGLACAADFRVASPSTRFVANFARLGFHHGFALTITLPRIVGPQTALRLLLTPGDVRGEAALELGLADRLAPEGRVREVAQEFAADVVTLAPLAVAAIKRTMRGDLREAVRSALDHELVEQQRLWLTRDSRIGIEASLSRDTPVFIGE
jgi:enoyl-CoA hydratase/carnithine racemase